MNEQHGGPIEESKLRRSVFIGASTLLVLGGLAAIAYGFSGTDPSTDTALANATELTEFGSSTTEGLEQVETTETTLEATTTTIEETTTTTIAPTTTEAPTTTSTPTTAAPTTEAPSTVGAAETTTAPTAAGLPTAEQWEQLRQCEATGNYQAVNPVGYYGAYQFNQQTWDGIAAELGRTDLVGVRPHTASPADQDALAQRLWDNRGWQPWPACSSKLGFR